MKGQRPASWKVISIRLFVSALLVLTTLVSVVPAAAADVLYVAPAAAGGGDCSGWADACTLGTALADAVSGDQIWVQAGVHKPGATRSDAFVLKGGVEIYGGFAGGETLLSERDWETNLTVLSGDIDNDDVTDSHGVVSDVANIVGDNSYHVVTAGAGVTGTARLDGFVITAGLANGSSPDDCGGGIHHEGGAPTLANLTVIGNSATTFGGGLSNTNGGSPVLTDSTFEGNLATFGGGIYNEAASPGLSRVTLTRNVATDFGGGMYSMMSDLTLSRVTVSENTARAGGGLYNFYSTPVLTDCAVISNTASTGGAGMYNLQFGDAILVNVALIGNSAGTSGGGMVNDRSNPALTNVTIVGNSAQYGGGIYNAVGDPTLANVLMWGNTASEIGDQISGAGTPEISYSLIQDSGGSGDDWDDTLGTDGGGNIDADPLLVDPDGADDIPGTADDDLRPGFNSPAIDAGDNTAVPAGVELDLGGAPRFIDDPYAPDGGNGGAPLVDIGAHEAAWVRYAAPSPAGGADCTTWADACTLQTALDDAVDGVKIWAQMGLYKPTETTSRGISFDLVPGVEVYGGFAGTETQFDQRDWETHLSVLSGDIGDDDITDPTGVVTDVVNIVGDNSYHVVTAGGGVTETARLDGFVITAGFASDAGDNGMGGGMAIISSSPTVANVVFIANLTYGGGGAMYNRYSTPTLENVTLRRNRAYTGGAMYNDHSSPVLSNVTVEDNRANYAGGIRNNLYSSPVLTDVMISGNTSTEGNGGGMYNYWSSNPTLTDVTFYGNYADAGGGGLANSSSNPSLINVRFIGNSTRLYGGGMRNITSNPLLVNVIFSGNAASGGGGLYNTSSSPSLINATFTSNTATGAGGGIINSNSNYTLTNVIAWGNVAPGTTDDVYGTGSTLTIINSLIGEPDPRFVDADGPDDTAGTLDDDLRLLPDSPAIDAGRNSAVPVTVTTDLASLPRFIDIPFVPDTGSGSPPIVDIGAHEAGCSGLALAKQASPAVLVPGDPLTFTLSLSNTGYVTAGQVLLSDAIPSLVQVNAILTGGLAITDTGYEPAFVWDVQDLAPLTAGSITIAGEVPTPAPAGVYTNTATAAYRLYDFTTAVTGSVVFTVANTAPFFTSAPETAATQDAPYAYAVTTQELNGEVVTVTATALPGWLALTDYGDRTALLAGTPGNSQVGQHPVVLEVTDSVGLQASQAFTITVANLNDAPVFTSTPVTTGTQLIPYTYTVAATDPDLIFGDVLTITAPTLPGWLGLTDHGDGTATLSGTPEMADLGDHEVELQVTDDGGVTGTQPFTVTVGERYPYRIYLPLVMVNAS